MAAQSDVGFVLHTDAAQFEVIRFELHEGISQLFALTLDVSSPRAEIEARMLLDKDVEFSIERDGVAVRQVHGIVTAFEQVQTGFRRSRYRLTVEPALARLGLWHGSRIHQQQTVPALLETRLKERGLGYRPRLSQSHEVREYCVQHRETDLAFFARLTAEEGCAWYFDARSDSQLVLSDALQAGPSIGEPITYQPNPGGEAEGPHLRRFALRQQLATARLVQRDYTFKNPLYSLEHRGDARAPVGAYEFYDAPGRYKRDEAGKPFTRSRLTGLRSQAKVAHIEGDDTRLWPGLAFLLADQEDLPASLQGDWRIVTMHHVGEQAVSQEEDSADAPHGTRYSYTATAIPGDQHWLPEPLPRPVMDGPQMAHVVGPPNEEIHTDEHGRVMVWFPWDRDGPKENATCWIRVSQGWAGTMYGFMAIPRIGHEVIVSFLDGDPDQPLVTGRAYHAANRPPYALPLHKTRTTFKTQTHKGQGYNELRFEDEAGQEEIFIHAQRDQNIVIEHDETTRIGHNRSEDVGNDEAITIGHDRSESVGNDETLSIGQDRKETLGRDHATDIGRNRQLKVGKDLIEDVGNVRIEKTASDRRVQTGGHYTHKVAGRIDVEAGERIGQRTRTLDFHAADKFILRGPGGTITIDSKGVTLDGIAVFLKGPVAQDRGTGNALVVSGQALAALPPGETLALAYTYADGKPVAFAPFRVAFNDGSHVQGRLDEHGKAIVANVPDAGNVQFGYDQRDAFPLKRRPPNLLYGFKPETPSEARIAIEKYKAQEQAYLQDEYFPDEIEAMQAGNGYDDLIEDYEYDGEVCEHDEEEDDDSDDHREVLLDPSEGEGRA